MAKRNLVSEIVEKRTRLLSGAPRFDQFNARVHPLVAGFRHLRGLADDVRFRNEWLKYGAIGYIACVEGYMRLLIADLIDSGEPFVSRVNGFKDLRLSIEPITAIQTGKLSFGEFVAHLLPLNGVDDINSHMTTLLGTDFLTLFFTYPVQPPLPRTLRDEFPDTVERFRELYTLRHRYAHELAGGDVVDPDRIDKCIGGAALFVIHTEDLVRIEYLSEAPIFKVQSP